MQRKAVLNQGSNLTFHTVCLNFALGRSSLWKSRRDRREPVMPSNRGKAAMNPNHALALVLSLAAVAARKQALSQADEDAYLALRATLLSRYPKVPIDLLESAPESEPRRALVEEELTDVSAGDDRELLEAANQLLRSIQQYAPEIALALGIKGSVHEASASFRGEGIITGTGNIIVGGRATGIRPAEAWPPPGTSKK
jgi:hypothetical protein